VVVGLCNNLSDLKINMTNKKVDDQDLMVAQLDGDGDRERASFGLFLTQRASFGVGKKAKIKNTVVLTTPWFVTTLCEREYKTNCKGDK
jgi:hypothetical protein